MYERVARNSIESCPDDKLKYCFKHHKTAAFAPKIVLNENDVLSNWTFFYHFFSHFSGVQFVVISHTPIRLTQFKYVNVKQIFLRFSPVSLRVQNSIDANRHRMHGFRLWIYQLIKPWSFPTQKWKFFFSPSQVKKKIFVSCSRLATGVIRCMEDRRAHTIIIAGKTTTFWGPEMLLLDHQWVRILPKNFFPSSLTLRLLPSFFLLPLLLLRLLYGFRLERNDICSLPYTFWFMHRTSMNGLCGYYAWYVAVVKNTFFR